MSRVSSRCVCQVALVLGSALVPSGFASAQETLVATARMSTRAISSAGVDSGKFLVSVKIGGIPEIGLRNLKINQIVLVDAWGRSHSPWGFSFGKDTLAPKTLLASYMAPQPASLADREYMFMVPPGLTTFEVRVGNLKPVRVVASIRGPYR